MTKEELRTYLASLPLDDKFDLLEQLRQRNLDVAEAREELRRKLHSDPTS
jgi:hypothetical protein